MGKGENAGYLKDLSLLGWQNIWMGECNTILSAYTLYGHFYTLYRHLGQYCTHQTNYYYYQCRKNNKDPRSQCAFCAV